PWSDPPRHRPRIEDAYKLYGPTYQSRPHVNILSSVNAAPAVSSIKPDRPTNTNAFHPLIGLPLLTAPAVCNPNRRTLGEPNRVRSSARCHATQLRSGRHGRAECAFDLGQRFVDGSRVRCLQKRLDCLRARDHLGQLRQPRQMKLLILEPEHEEEMRRPSVERGEVHSLPRPP